MSSRTSGLPSDRPARARTSAGSDTPHQPQPEATTRINRATTRPRTAETMSVAAIGPATARSGTDNLSTRVPAPTQGGFSPTSSTGPAPLGRRETPRPNRRMGWPLSRLRETAVSVTTLVSGSAGSPRSEGRTRPLSAAIGTVTDCRHSQPGTQAAALPSMRHVQFVIDTRTDYRREAETLGARKPGARASPGRSRSRWNSWRLGGGPCCTFP